MLSGTRLIQRGIVQQGDLRKANFVRHDKERHVLIVGAGTLASLYVRFLESHCSGERRIAAILDDNRNLHGRSILGHTIVGDSQEASALLDDFAQHGLDISGVVVCESDRERAFGYRDRLEPLCRSRGLQLELLVEAPGIFGAIRAVQADPLSPVALSKAGYFQTRRVIEPVVAAVCLVAFLPLFVLTGLLALASVGWPVIFWQRRIGLHGRTIFVYKFKTMRNPIDGNGRRLTLYERQTRIGKFLRATRLDELPQLINIIQGNMAVIGPRPLLPVDQPAEASLPASRSRPELPAGLRLTAASSSARRRRARWTSGTCATRVSDWTHKSPGGHS